jgi:hypothetical protein
METFGIKFVCSQCEGSSLVEIRTDAAIKNSIQGFCLSDGGKGKYAPLSSFAGSTEGKTQHYKCECCGHIITNAMGNPITNTRLLFLWLKRNEMLEEVVPYVALSS